MTQTPLRPAPAVGARASASVSEDVPAAPSAGPSAGPSAHRSAGAPAQPPAGTGSRRPWALALVVYSALVAVVVGWPTPVDAGAHGALTTVLAALHDAGVPRFVDYDLVERTANVLMFVPLGLLVTRVTRRWWWGVVVPAALSGAAELTQHLLRPERFATWTNVATNTAGAAVGVVVAVVLMRRRARTAPRS